LDVATEIGVNKAALNLVVRRARRAGGRGEHRDVATIGGRVREQRRDRLASAQIGAGARATGLVVFAPARGQLGIVDLAQEDALLRVRQCKEVTERIRLGPAIAETFREPVIKLVAVGLRHLAVLVSEWPRTGQIARIEIKLGKAGPVHLSGADLARADTGLHDDTSAEPLVAGGESPDAFDRRGRSLIDVAGRRDLERAGARNQPAWLRVGVKPWPACIDDAATRRD
ncbi:hypothetical protein chiPu_0031087, partial [Chiloscyllium punctatum]|nr:hypothetical protein [Chiloscyllium punctatum]